MNEIESYHPWLIGGPARNGKTTLINALYNNKGSVIGLPVEGLLLVYLRKWRPLLGRQQKELLTEYLSRPRSIDSMKCNTAKPIDFFKTDLNNVLKIVLEDRHEHHIGLIDSALKLFARQNGAITWAACDLHPEFRYKKILQHIEKLNLAVMLRDPRESIAASLYWRDFPQRCINSKSVFYHRLQMWAMSAEISMKCREANVDSIKTFNFNKLVSKDKNECARLSSTFGGEISFYEHDEPPYFSYVPSRGFYCPDKKWRFLLDDYEINMIEEITMPFLTYFGYEKASNTDANKNKPNKSVLYLLRSSIFIGRRAPYFIKSINDMFCAPASYFRLYLNIFKEDSKKVLKVMFGLH